MKKNKKSKRKTVDNHFAIRCLQRLGYIPNKDDIVKAIQRGELTFFERQSNRVTRWLWIDPIHSIECIIPYDKERKQVITVLFKREEEENASKSSEE